MVEQATENRCVGGSIPPLGTIIMRLFYLLLFLCVSSGFSCKMKSKDYFPTKTGLKWTYSLVLKSSYTGKNYSKRIFVTNVKSRKKGDQIEILRLYSDGSYYSYVLTLKKRNLKRMGVILSFDEGIVEPVKKVVYPDIDFKKKEWVVKEQLFLVEGYQPPLLNIKPRPRLNMTYKIIKKHDEYKTKGKIYRDCIEITGKGSTDFIADTRSGSINVEVQNHEIICDGFGLIKQERLENTNASAFGNMILSKELIGFN